MPALTPTDFTGKVTFLGHVSDRNIALASIPQSKMALSFAGNLLEVHSGLTRPSCSRMLGQYPRDTEIRNTRQLCIMSVEELEGIAAEMGMDLFEPTWAGASIVVEGIPNFTLIPPSSRLQFSSGATLCVDMANRPCVLPAAEIDKDQPNAGKRFKPAAKNRRGVTAWVEREGIIEIGSKVRLHVPEQPVWPHFP